MSCLPNAWERVWCRTCWFCGNSSVTRPWDLWCSVSMLSSLLCLWSISSYSFIRVWQELGRTDFFKKTLNLESQSFFWNALDWDKFHRLENKVWENIILAETKFGVYGPPSSARGLGSGIPHNRWETLSSGLLVVFCFEPAFCLFMGKKFQRWRLVLMRYRKTFENFNAFSGKANYFSSCIKMYKCAWKLSQGQAFTFEQKPCKWHWFYLNEKLFFPHIFIPFGKKEATWGNVLLWLEVQIGQGMNDHVKINCSCWNLARLHKVRQFNYLIIVLPLAFEARNIVILFTSPPSCV